MLKSVSICHYNKKVFDFILDDEVFWCSDDKNVLWNCGLVFSRPWAQNCLKTASGYHMHVHVLRLLPLVHAGHWDMSCLIVLEVWKSKRQTWLYTCSLFQLFILYFANTPSPCWLSQFEPLPLESKAPATVVLLLNSPEEDILIKACEAIQTFAEKGMVGYPPLTLPHIIDCFYFYGQPCSWIAENPVLILLSGWCFVMVYFFDLHFLNPEIATFAIHFITICLIFLFTVSPCC